MRGALLTKVEVRKPRRDPVRLAGRGGP